LGDLAVGVIKIAEESSAGRANFDAFRREVSRIYSMKTERAFF
jgi:predicted amidohydrolase